MTSLDFIKTKTAGAWIRKELVSRINLVKSEPSNTARY